MSDNPNQGRWDHLLREIPSKETVQQNPASPPTVAPAAQAVEVIEKPMTTESDDRIYKVSELNHAIKMELEGKFPTIWIQGEISNFKAHTSGHYYFCMKDDKAQVSAVMFKGYNSRLKFNVESGMEVIARGKITVFEPRGTYQLFCEHIEPVGAGALQKAFEQLKEKLNREGIFAQDKKKPIPQFPKKLGVVTSPTGAAIQDILNVLGRRSKRVQVTVIPARVQGEGAASEVVRGIEVANRINDFDVLIVGRGGGSIEDLWCFNEEVVARAIFNSKIPIISAVGHEIDFTISDFVADLRAPTPSAAAELVAKSEEELQEKIKFYSKSLRLICFQRIADRRKQVRFNEQRLIDPRRFLQDCMLKLDDWNQRLHQSTLRLFEKRKMQVKLSHQTLKNPLDIIQQRQVRRKSLTKLLVVAMKRHLTAARNGYVKNTSLLDSLSPLRVVDRGYAIVRSGNKLIASVSDLANEPLDIELKDGFVSAKVLEVKNKEKK